MHRPKEKIVNCPACGVKIVLGTSGLIPFHKRWDDIIKDFVKYPGIGRAIDA